MDKLICTITYITFSVFILKPVLSHYCYKSEACTHLVGMKVTQKWLVKQVIFELLTKLYYMDKQILVLTFFGHMK